jgi:hypothetical protein
MQVTTTPITKPEIQRGRLLRSRFFSFFFFLLVATTMQRAGGTSKSIKKLSRSPGCVSSSSNLAGDVLFEGRCWLIRGWTTVLTGRKGTSTMGRQDIWAVGVK